MQGDGDGWVQCAQGHRHWGRNGAAGLLLRAPGTEGDVRVLLQHRAEWTHEGGTWGIPGGARDSHETMADAALREAAEEASLPLERVRTGEEHVVDHGGWTYTTVLADADALLPTVLQRESVELRWVAEADVDALPLHPGFAASWPVLRAPAVRLVVDAANVVGSRPDGWWRDRAGATTRLLERLRALSPAVRPGRVVRLPAGALVRVGEVVVVVEGRAAAVEDVAGVEVLRAPGSGDDTVAGAVVAGSAGGLVVVTADRGLRDRLPDGAVAAGPRWLLDLVDAA
ncbi:NUDIX hydrolase [Vallicoccus soli]|uniref:NUDIX domain-containing protein n=1 Tax=Vallicoccus soli TaxID=2339232 RepID=A0A3A3Z134_9ACTN|nr:NUDIX domain-containing protein [Vallicoccus soli]RJK96292.1 NUDIX domain-containing protein [Vallicoccus soli]